MGSIWPFFVVLVVHFALVFTKSNWLKNKTTYLFLYLPAIAFWFIELSTNLINTSPILEYWGYNDVPSYSAIYWISTIWTAALPILAFILCFRFYRQTGDHQRQQRKLVAVGFAIPIAAFIVTNILGRAIDVDIPNLGIVATSFFSCFVGYAIVKHNLFTFDPAIAAENIFSTMPDSLVLADMQGKIFKVNRRLVSLLGYSESELIGKIITVLCADSKTCENALNELTEKKVARNLELAFKTKVGEERIILFSGSVVKNSMGRDVGITCVFRDITERKEMEERLVKAERFASIGELAGQIGHDLRNPLTGIKSGAYFLRKKGDLLSSGERNMILDTIDNAVEDSNRIVNSLVDYSSELHLQMEPCTPKSLLKHILPGIEVPQRMTIIDSTDDGISLSLDAQKIERVFANLIQNAIEATPEKGTIEIRSARKGSTVEIAFIDTGIGIPGDVLPKLFSPLMTTKAKGMGMSLAICKRIMEAHSGKISVESTIGKGTTFTLILPIKPKVEFLVAGNDLEKIEAQR